MYINLTDDEADYLRCFLISPDTVPGGVDHAISIVNKITHQFDRPESEEAYVEAACRHRLLSDGVLEIDDSLLVSEGDDNGAYVMAWLWVEDTDT